MRRVRVAVNGSEAISAYIGSRVGTLPEFLADPTDVLGDRVRRMFVIWQ